MAVALGVASALVERRIVVPLARRLVARNEIRQRRLWGVCDVHAGGAQILDHAGARGLVQVLQRRPAESSAGRRRPPPRAGGELRHLQELQRLRELVEIDARAFLQLTDIAFGERAQARGQRAQLSAGRSRARSGPCRSRAARTADAASRRRASSGRCWRARRRCAWRSRRRSAWSARSGGAPRRRLASVCGRREPRGRGPTMASGSSGWTPSRAMEGRRENGYEHARNITLGWQRGKGAYVPDAVQRAAISAPSRLWRNGAPLIRDRINVGV